MFSKPAPVSTRRTRSNLKNSSSKKSKKQTGISPQTSKPELAALPRSRNSSESNPSSKQPKKQSNHFFENPENLIPGLLTRQICSEFIIIDPVKNALNKIYFFHPLTQEKFGSSEKWVISMLETIRLDIKSGQKPRLYVLFNGLGLEEPPRLNIANSFKHDPNLTGEGAWIKMRDYAQRHLKIIYKVSLEYLPECFQKNNLYATMGLCNFFAFKKVSGTEMLVNLADHTPDRAYVLARAARNPRDQNGYVGLLINNILNNHEASQNLTTMSFIDDQEGTITEDEKKMNVCRNKNNNFSKIKSTGPPKTQKKIKFSKFKFH